MGQLLMFIILFGVIYFVSDNRFLFTCHIGSTTIALMIIRYPRGLKSIYSRIIFGLSIFDIFQSLWILTSPFLSPSNDGDLPQGLWSRGTTGSCEAIGFIGLFGSSGIPLYTLFLTFYFLLKVKYKVDLEEFSKKKEWIFHSFIWVFGLIGATYALAKQEINPTRNGSLCTLVPKPFNCWIDDSVECTRGPNALMTGAIFLSIPLVIIFILLIVFLGMLTQYVFQQEKMIHMQANAYRVSNENDVFDDKSDSEERISDKGTVSIVELVEKIRQEESEAMESSNIPKEEDEIEQDKIAKTPNSNQNIVKPLSITRQSFHQSFLYILAFFLVWSLPVFFFFASLRKSTTGVGDWFFLALSIFFPASGFFNILIYTRPKILLLQRAHPNTRWIQRFSAVVIAGGEMPTILDEID